MEEDQLALPFACFQGAIAGRFEIFGKAGQLMIMRGEQGPAGIDAVQMLCG